MCRTRLYLSVQQIRIFLHFSTFFFFSQIKIIQEKEKEREREANEDENMNNNAIRVARATFLLTITFGITIFLVSLNFSSQHRDPMVRSFILWLHGLGDSGPANEPIKTLFRSPEFRNTVWSFPSAPSNPVTCNYGAVMPSWFDIHEIPITADSPKDESSLLKAVQNIHEMIDKEITVGTNPENVFVCGFSQGGALTLASVLLYPKTLGGGAVFSGWIPFNSSIQEQIKPPARKTPLLWSHGISDRTVLFEAGQAGPPFLERAGMSCEFKAYPGLGHSISNEELHHLELWIKARLQSSS